MNLKSVILINKICKKSIKHILYFCSTFEIIVSLIINSDTALLKFFCTVLRKNHVKTLYAYGMDETAKTL